LARRHLFGAYTLALWGVLAVSPIAALQAPEFPTLATDHPIGEGFTQPCLPAVEGEAICGRFRVLEDRTRPAGRTIDVAFVVLKALNDGGHVDAYTRFNGGPGSPMTPAANSMAGRRADIRADRDVLLVDHRGTGNSTPLGCNNAYPTGMRSRFETVMPLDHVDGCRDMLSRRHDLSQYTTPNSMDDLAELSEWLGYAQLNINGGSYGTVEAQVFTRRHPDMVRTVIMNGVAPLQDRVYVHHARYLQESLENMYAECAEQSECSEAYPDLQAVTEEVLQTASTRPRLVRAGSMRSPFRIGPLSYALRGLLYGQSGTVPARIYEAKDGNWQTLADYYVQRQSWVGTTAGVPAGYHFSVLCAEDIDPLTWPEIEEASAGTFMGDYLIAGYKRACDRWPSAEMPASFFEPVTSNKPVLILSGGRDPVTPVVGGNKMAEQWPNSVHVVVPNGGHGQGGPCITAMLVHLIRTGSVSGIDTSCVQSRPPTAFEISGR
jgi:pimeloyl-ACP methyl ester carboxylesterase